MDQTPLVPTTIGRLRLIWSSSTETVRRTAIYRVSSVFPNPTRGCGGCGNMAPWSFRLSRCYVRLEGQRRGKIFFAERGVQHGANPRYLVLRRWRGRTSGRRLSRVETRRVRTLMSAPPPGRQCAVRVRLFRSPGGARRGFELERQLLRASAHRRRWPRTMRQAPWTDRRRHRAAAVSNYTGRPLRSGARRSIASRMATDRRPTPVDALSADRLGLAFKQCLDRQRRLVLCTRRPAGVSGLEWLSSRVFRRCYPASTASRR